MNFRATRPEDFAAIADLATDVFHLEHENPFRDRSFQEWKYWRPHVDWNGSRSYVMEVDGKMVAHGCTWPMRFQTVAREWRGQFLIDWAAAPSAPGAAIALLRRTAANVDGVCAIGGSEMTRAIMPKIGFRSFNPVWLGASALGLQRVLGLGSYETAWTWLHKLRRAMIRPDRDRLRGWIEVDETFIGGLAEGAVGGRQKTNKALVVIAAQADEPANRTNSDADDRGCLRRQPARFRHRLY